ncbi:mechanosensitive ion channel family protein [Tateyamaria sp.]|uniref:mechanosensitive ion channel family protein n=1 Tax=Tateyamaria sp. TaxID=1929288 RepID=UPI00329E4C18
MPFRTALNIFAICQFAILIWLGTITFAQEQTASAFSAPEPSAITTTAAELELLTVPMTTDELSDLATAWQDHIKTLLEQSAVLNLELEVANDARSEVLRTELANALDQQRDVQGSYEIVIEAWRVKGAPPEDIQAHETYLNALRLEAVRTTDAKTLFQFVIDWLTSSEGGLGLLLKIAGFLLALWGMYFAARVLRRTASRGLSRIPNLSRLLQRFIVNAVYWATFVLGILVILALFGVNVTPLFAVFGGLSFIIGFALQDTLGNLASGLMIMILKPFDTGDYIEVSGASGFVDEMSIVSTQIRTFDNQVIVVPNSKIWGDVITNVSVSPERRIDLVFGIGYSDNTALAIEVLKELVAAHPKCLKDPAPEIFVGELGESSVNIFCRPWSKSDDYWIVYWDLTGQAKERFDAEGISIPFPQRDVHLIQEDKGALDGA